MEQKLSLRKKLALNVFSSLRKKRMAEHNMRFLFWEVTLRCNLSCAHCGSDCRQDARVPDMPMNDFLRAVDQLTPYVEPDKTLVIFTGGEPLLRADLEACGVALNQRGFPWGMVSNGLALTELRLKTLLESGLQSITISLDGLENTHNQLRGNQKSYAKAMQAIRMLAKVEGLKFDVVTCVHPGNLHQLNVIKQSLLAAGVCDWRIFTIFPVGRAADNEALKLSPNQFKRVMEFITKVRGEGQMKLSYGCEGFLGDYEGEVRDGFFFCQAGVNVASVLADGSISACPNLRGNYIQGNIYTDDPGEVWENRFQLHRDRSWTKTGSCATCKKYKYCLGNGLHLRDEKSGELAFCHLEWLEAAD